MFLNNQHDLKFVAKQLINDSATLSEERNILENVIIVQPCVELEIT